MKTPIEKIQVFRQEEFDKTSSTRQFPIGTRVRVVDNSSETTSKYVTEYEYNVAGDALQQYGVFALCNVTSSAGIAAFISTSPGTAVGCYRVIVPQTNVVAGSYFWGAVKGLCTAAFAAAAAGVYTSTIAGAQLVLVGNLTQLSPQTVSKSAATAPSIIREVQSIAAVSGLSGTTGNAVSVYLYGDNVFPNQAATWAGDNTML